MVLAVACAGSRPKPSTVAPAPPAVGSPHSSEAQPSVSEPLATTSPSDTASAAAAPSAPTIDLPEPEKLPLGFVEVPFETGEGIACESLRIEHVFEGQSPPFVRVWDASGRKLYEAKGRQYTIEHVAVRMSLTAEVCGDTTGDGIPELLMAERTEGAHCCYTYYVVSMTRPAKRLLMWEKGDGGHGLMPVKLIKGRAWQIRSWELVFPPFDVEAGDPVLSYATTPAYPILFELVGDQYVKRTFSFGNGLRSMRTEARDACRRAPDSCSWNELDEWGYGLIIGDWDTEKTAAVPDVELRNRLDARAKQMKTLLRKRLGP